MIRTVQMGFTSEIIVLKVSIWLGLLITGHADGQIAVWDFEKSSIVSFLRKHTEMITDILFVDRYPVAVTCANDGLLCIWHLQSF